MGRKNNEMVIDGQRYEFVVRKSKRAKHILLQVDAAGMIKVVAPYRVSVKEAGKFARQKKEWIKKAWAANKKRRDEIPRRSLDNGEELMLLGEARRLEVIVEEKRQRSFFVDGRDYVRVTVSDKKKTREVLEEWYRREARDYFGWKVNKLAGQLKVKVKKIVISDAGSQWGSCNKITGRISLHWRLLLGPKEVADYVAAHEAAHLIEANHGQKYWQIVAGLDPEYEERRRWLRRYGHTLTL